MMWQTDARNACYVSMHTGSDAAELCFQTGTCTQWLQPWETVLRGFLRRRKTMLMLTLALNNKRERKWVYEINLASANFGEYHHLPVLA